MLEIFLLEKLNYFVVVVYFCFALTLGTVIDSIKINKKSAFRREIKLNLTRIEKQMTHDRLY